MAQISLRSLHLKSSMIISLTFQVGPMFDYAQPGVDVLSTEAGQSTVSYNSTSMAAPHFCSVILASGLVMVKYHQQMER